jgi:hypothetical protein
MDINVATILIGVVGIGVIVVGALLLYVITQQQQQQAQGQKKEEVIIQNDPLSVGWAGGWLPYYYYSRVPYRPILY